MKLNKIENKGIVIRTVIMDMAMVTIIPKCKSMKMYAKEDILKLNNIRLWMIFPKKM